MTVRTCKKWTIDGTDGVNSLKFHESGSVPSLGEHDVLVKFHAAALNYRDNIIVLVGAPSAKDPFKRTGTDQPNVPNIGPISICPALRCCARVRWRRHR